MRILPSDEQQARQEKILQAVVHLFIKTGKPVGSTTILENFKLNLSPASIRNVLSDLEKSGYLTHPHTSAGRTPTDKGYRFYVDSIVHVQKLAVEEEKRIRHEYARRMKEVEDLMQSTTRILSTLSQCTGFAIAPSGAEEKLRRVELIPVSAAQVLGVLVSETGFVHNQMIGVNQTPDEETLRAAVLFLNQRLVGLSFTDAQERFFTELTHFSDRQLVQREFMETLSQQLFEGTSQRGVYVEGASNILNFPEFQDYESMRTFAHLVDEKKLLGNVLNRELSKKGLEVKIGVESAPELKNLSVVSTCYQLHGRPMGVLGILGPKRMEYERMMSIVNSVANLVNRFLEGDESRFLEGKDAGE
jgi:heat-inducible transcriptional repressor